MPPRRQAAKRAAAAKAAKAKKAAEVVEEKETGDASEETAVEETSVTEEPAETAAEVEEETTDVQAEDGSELMQGIEEALSGHEPAAEEGEGEGQQVEEGQPEEAAQEQMVEEVGDNGLAAETENAGLGEWVPVEEEPRTEGAEMEDTEKTSTPETDTVVGKEGKVWPKPEKELPMKGRVLRVHPVLMQDLVCRAAAPILKAAVGYIIRSEGGSKPQKKTSTMDSARSLEIWFHSEEEAEEMFVRICNFQWMVNGKQARVVRVNCPDSVDVTLKEWDRSVAPLGMYDGRCLFVNGIPPNTTEDDLKALFDNTRKIQIPTDEEGNQQGYALIEFWSKANAIESSKKKLTMQEKELVLHTIGIQRIPRSKAAQDRLDQEMKRIREQGVLTDFPTPRVKGPRNSTDGNKRDGRQNQGGRNRRDSNSRQSQGGRNQQDGNRRNRPGGQRDDGWGKRRFSGGSGGGGGRDKASPTKRGRFSSGSMGGDRRGRGGGRDNADSIRGELLGQMQTLQQGGLTDPQLLMNLAKKLQQAQKSNY